MRTIVLIRIAAKISGILTEKEEKSQSNLLGQIVENEKKTILKHLPGLPDKICKEVALKFITTVKEKTHAEPSPAGGLVAPEDAGAKSDRKRKELEKKRKTALKLMLEKFLLRKDKELMEWLSDASNLKNLKEFFTST